jgi:hypothetical protein
VAASSASRRHRRGRWATLIVSVAVLAAGCSSSGDDPDDDGDAADTGDAGAESGAGGTAGDTPGALSGESGDPGTGPAATSGLDTPPPGAAVSTPAPTAAPADTGVPGLDSDDSFCAAWSRFGGSWQLLVQAAFNAEQAEAMRLEVIASTLVGEAYDAVFAAWPSELEPERELVAADYFGAFQRRSAEARQTLVEAGASDADVAAIADVWARTLEQYDPLAETIVVALPDELEPVVTAAAVAFAERRVPLPADPSMVITAETPMTDAYLASGCPDEGWIVGQDVQA